MIVLGLNGFLDADHDAGAAVVIGNSVASAVEEERLCRVKRAVRHRPTSAAKEALALAGCAPEDVNVVAYAWSPSALGLRTQDCQDAILSQLRESGCRLSPEVQVEFVDHHIAHAWCGIAYVEPDSRRDGVDVLVLDGCGESSAGGLFHLVNGDLKPKWHLSLESSLGLFYEAITTAVGFGWGQEGKTMGLASYGSQGAMALDETLPDDRSCAPLPVRTSAPEFHAKYAKLLRAYAHEIKATLPAGASFIDRANLCSAAEQSIIERVWEWLGEIETPSPTTVLSGGVALNCTMNRALAPRLRSRGSSLVIPPPANDSGVALGAAVATSDDPMTCVVPADYGTGREYSTSTVTQMLRDIGLQPEAAEPADVAALLVEEDSIVGWFSGRAEIGPRALGRRCIIARPDSTRVRDTINFHKGREPWRPLAPSVDWRDFDRLFDGDPSKYMLVTSEVRGSAVDALAGVCHVDNTSRPQVVLDEGPYLGCIRAVGELTGTSAVTCTSFNVAGEPIVYTPHEAASAAARMSLRALAGDDWLARLPR